MRWILTAVFLIIAVIAYDLTPKERRPHLAVLAAIFFGSYALSVLLS